MISELILGTVWDIGIDEELFANEKATASRVSYLNKTPALSKLNDLTRKIWVSGIKLLLLVLVLTGNEGEQAG